MLLLLLVVVKFGERGRHDEVRSKTAFLLIKQNNRLTITCVTAVLTPGPGRVKPLKQFGLDQTLEAQVPLLSKPWCYR